MGEDAIFAPGFFSCRLLLVPSERSENPTPLNLGASLFHAWANPDRPEMNRFVLGLFWPMSPMDQYFRRVAS